MTKPRSEVVRPGEDGAYHVVTRCVRRAFLCGLDEQSGRNFEHRRGWIRDRLEELAGIFAAEVFGYSVMANHLHAVIQAVPSAATGWSDREVAERWLQLFPKRRVLDGATPTPSADDIQALCADVARIKLCRERLGDISWFMRCLNEPIARRANREDECTGRFWEGRFKCQRLLDESAILACMAYVDLNPIRAGIAKTPEKSDFTSAQDRIASGQARQEVAELERVESQLHVDAVESAALDGQLFELLMAKRVESQRDAWLAPIEQALSINLDEYLEILDWTGREIQAGKRGMIPDHLAPILQRLRIDRARWVETASSFGKLFRRVAGRAEAMLEAAKLAGKRWFQGVMASAQAFSPA